MILKKFIYYNIHIVYWYGDHSDRATSDLVSISVIKSIYVLFCTIDGKFMGISESCRPFINLQLYWLVLYSFIWIYYVVFLFFVVSSWFLFCIFYLLSYFLLILILLFGVLQVFLYIIFLFLLMLLLFD